MEPADLIAKYRLKGVLLDTNLLVLLVVGLYRRDRIPKHRRTKSYTIQDFVFITRLVAHFSRRLTTPHILAEADNLIRQLDAVEHRAMSAVMTSVVSTLFEVYVPSSTAISQKDYAHLGLTDSVVLIAAATEDVLVVTADNALANSLSRLGRDVLNINHIRARDWT